jgi:4-fold beta flower protein
MPLAPLFSRDCDLVGWLEPDRYVFDRETNYVAFIVDRQAWSASGERWLGAVNGLTLCDRAGKPVAWSKQPVAGTSAGMVQRRPMLPKVPMRPVKPLTPVRPLRPDAPRGGWSAMTFSDWLGPKRQSESGDPDASSS